MTVYQVHKNRFRRKTVHTKQNGSLRSVHKSEKTKWRPETEDAQKGCAVGQLILVVKTTARWREVVVTRWRTTAGFHLDCPAQGWCEDYVNFSDQFMSIVYNYMCTLYSIHVKGG